MRKSLGSKRKLLTEETIKEVVELYSRYETSPIAKLFKTTEFGYRRITIERPLKLAFYPKDADRLAALQADKAWEKLDGTTQSAILNALSQIKEDKVLCRETFKKQPLQKA